MDVFGHPFQLMFGAPQQPDGAAILGKSQGSCSPNAGTRAGDQRHTFTVVQFILMHATLCVIARQLAAPFTDCTGKPTGVTEMTNGNDEQIKPVNVPGGGKEQSHGEGITVAPQRQALRATMDIQTTNFKILPGEWQRLGARYTGEGVNFALFSAHADRVELCLYDPSGTVEIARMDLPDYTNEIWHGFVPGLKPGALYGFRVHGPFEPENGHRFNHNKLLLDPYARELVGDIRWSSEVFGYHFDDPDKDMSFNDLDSAAFMPKCRVVDPNQVDWGNDRRPQVSWADTIVYETHVKGFTQLNPAIPQELREYVRRPRSQGGG